MKEKASDKYDAVIVGSGPNGLAAGIRLVQEGLSVLIVEASDTTGGGMRTKQLMQPDVWHDVCSAIHPTAVASPFFKRLPLQKHGLNWIYPKHPVAHPLDNESAVIAYDELSETAFHLGEDERFYQNLVTPLKESWPGLSGDLLAPLRFPKNPVKMLSFGLKGIQPATLFSRNFKTERAKALFAGMAAHSIQPLSHPATTAIGLVFFATLHSGGWPMAKGGSQSIADSLSNYFKALGGDIQTSFEVKSLEELPPSKVVLFDLTPFQVARIAGSKLPLNYLKKLRKYRYGSGAFKIDYILSEPVPWKDYETRRAGTVHLGGTFEEIARSEKEVYDGKHADDPYVIVAQQSLFDSDRTPDNRHTLWAYCHVPNGSETDMTEAMEKQIERFAPGFRDVIEQKTTMNTAHFQQYNPNYIGGDINGGSQHLGQLFSRPVHFINPYAMPAKGLYFCSSSTPPGGGVHGMCGYHAANLVLRKEFGINESKWKFKT
ncbi:MAG: NAD(P)/FAD-dependent oxidoreductase [Balneolaceae bacterium]|nr:MAG: NAD(P)/FAD-dependent oxidoreductase [Balneolaceae bacterium]